MLELLRTLDDHRDELFLRYDAGNLARFIDASNDQVADQLNEFRPNFATCFHGLLFAILPVFVDFCPDPGLINCSGWRAASRIADYTSKRKAGEGHVPEMFGAG
jgi:hypothetical protein